MKKRRPAIFIAVILMMAIGNYFRIKGNENIRTIQFLSIFVIGLLAGVLLRELITRARDKSI